MQWHKVTFTLNDIGSGKAVQLQDSFTQLWTDKSAPKDAALFSSRFDGKKSILYFSPGAVRVAHSLVESYAGVPCETPPRNSVFLVGHQDAKAKLLETLH